MYWRQVAKDNNRGLADLNKAIELEPDNAHAYMNRAAFYSLDLEDYNAAIADLTRAIEIEKQNSELALYYYQRGECYQKLNMYAEAIADYTKYISLTEQKDPKSVLLPWAYKLRAECYEAIGDKAKAQADKQKAKMLKH